MARRKARLQYWVLDFKAFVFWIALAFVAGSGPNLAGEVHPLFLLGLWVVAIGVALLVWIRNQRRRGVGVYIHLSHPEDEAAPKQATLNLYKWLSKKHRDWFRSGPDDPSAKTEDRIKLNIASIKHRIDEVEARDGEAPTFYFYIHCHLREAFSIGRTSAEMWERNGVHPLLPESSRPDGSIAVDLKVRSFSTYDNLEEGEIHQINLSLLEGVHSPRGKKYVAIEDLGNLLNGSEEIDRPRFAVLVHAGKVTQSGPSYSEFKESGLKAAKGSHDTGYIVSAADRCDKAIGIYVDEEVLYPKLQDGKAEEVVWGIYNSWRQKSQELYGSTDVPASVFLYGPSILAFTLGTFLPGGSHLVEFDRSRAPLPDDQAKNGLVAILDGDNVGDQTEQFLLSNQMEKAVSYSRHVTECLERLTRHLAALPGVRLENYGGDSAIFSFPVGRLSLFKKELQLQRQELNFSVSCGYGENSTEAFMSLRRAKTAGKNITIGKS